MVAVTLCSFDYMGEKAEVIAKCKKSILMDPGPLFVIQIGKYSSVLSQQAVNITDKIVRIAVEPVIVIIPALVRTELFIGAATNGVAAIETFPFHSTNVFIKIQKKLWLII
jgi:hypothetical protein